MTLSGGNHVSRLLLGGGGQGGEELAAYGKIDESDKELFALAAIRGVE